MCCLPDFANLYELSKSWRLAVGRARCWYGLVFDIQSWLRNFELQKRTVMDDRTTLNRRILIIWRPTKETYIKEPHQNPSPCHTGYDRKA